MVNLAIAPKHFLDHNGDKKKRKQLLEAWKKDVFLQEQITTFVITENDGVADVVRGQDITVSTIWGEGRIFEVLRMKPSPPIPPLPNTPRTSSLGEGGERDEEGKDAVRFQISPFSFFQTNTRGAEVLFSVGEKML